MECILDDPLICREIIELEIKVDLREDLNEREVLKLVNLYSQLIDYYLAVKSNRYLLFKNKINVLLTKPHIIDIIQGKK